MRRSFIFCYFAFFATIMAFAQTFQIENISIGQPWARFMPSTSRNGAIYLSLTNHGQNADRLVSVSSPHAKRVEIHTHIHDKGVMRMRHLEHGIPLAPGQTVQLSPGELHLMVLGTDRSYSLGEHLPIVLHFEKAGERRVNAIVQNQVK